MKLLVTFILIFLSACSYTGFMRLQPTSVPSDWKNGMPVQSKSGYESRVDVSFIKKTVDEYRFNLVIENLASHKVEVSPADIRCIAKDKENGIYKVVHAVDPEIEIERLRKQIEKDDGFSMLEVLDTTLMVVDLFDFNKTEQERIEEEKRQENRAWREKKMRERKELYKKLSKEQLRRHTIVVGGSVVGDFSCVLGVEGGDEFSVEFSVGRDDYQFGYNVLSES